MYNIKLNKPVADLGEWRGGPGPLLIWKKKITEGRKAARTSKTTLLLPSARGLNPPLQAMCVITSRQQ